MHSRICARRAGYTLGFAPLSSLLITFLFIYLIISVGTNLVKAGVVQSSTQALVVDGDVVTMLCRRRTNVCPRRSRSVFGDLECQAVVVWDRVSARYRDKRDIIIHSKTKGRQPERIDTHHRYTL